MASARAISRRLRPASVSVSARRSRSRAKSDFVQNLARTIFRGAARAFARMAIHGGDHKIVDDAQAAEGAHDLKSACDA